MEKDMETYSYNLGYYKNMQVGILKCVFLLFMSDGANRSGDKIAIREIVCYLWFPRGENMPHPAGATWGNNKIGKETEGARGEHGQET